MTMSLPTARALLLLQFLLGALLQFVFGKATQQCAPNRAEQAVAGLMTPVATRETAGEGAADAALAVGGLLAFLVVLWVLAVGSGEKVSGERYVTWILGLTVDAADYSFLGRVAAAGCAVGRRGRRLGRSPAGRNFGSAGVGSPLGRSLDVVAGPGSRRTVAADCMSPTCLR